MMNKKYQFIVITLLSIFIFACTLSSETPNKEQPVPITPELIQQEDIQEPSAPETYLPELPIGVVTEKDEVLSFLGRDGYTILQINTSGLAYADEDNLHIVSAFSEESKSLPVLYYSYEQNNSLLLSHKGSISSLLSAPDFSGMVGVPGKAVLAYTRVEYKDEKLISHLYVGTIEDLPSAAPVLTINDEKGWGLVALAIDVDAEKPIGVWYSMRPWGIGGDIVFDPRRTLHYLNLRSGENSQYLGVEANPSAISADRKWLAYTNDVDVGTGIGAMSLRNVEKGISFSYPLQNAVDQRGAGEAEFSPNNKYLAWMEGSGFQMSETPNFHSVVRVGNLNGNIIAEFADTAFLPISGLGMVARVEPVGWFDDDTLVVMARGESWNNAVLMMIDIPSKNISPLAPGVFAGFVYPLK